MARDAGGMLTRTQQGRLKQIRRALNLRHSEIRVCDVMVPSEQLEFI